MKPLNFVIVGVGGQGILLASDVLCQVGMAMGYDVKKTDVHGMAQRGGSVESHLRFGKVVFSPLIPHCKADFLVSFHAEEHLRLKSYLSPKGKDLIGVLLEAEKAVPDKKYVTLKNTETR